MAAAPVTTKRGGQGSKRDCPIGSRPFVRSLAAALWKKIGHSSNQLRHACSAVRLPVTSLSIWCLITSIIFSELSPGKDAHSVSNGNGWILVKWLGLLA